MHSIECKNIHGIHFTVFLCKYLKFLLAAKQRFISRKPPLREHLDQATTISATCRLTEIRERSMGVFSANTRSQFRNFFTGRRSDSAASSETRHGDEEAVSGNTIGLTIPENGFRPVSEFDGKMMEALFTEAGGGMGGGGDLELEADDRRHGGEGSRNWGANYGAAAAAVSGLDVRTLATRAVMGIGVASGDFSAEGLFDEDNADGWSELLQSGDAARDGYGFEAGFSDEPDGDWLEALRDGQQFPNLRGHGLLPDLSDAVELNDGLRQRVADFVASGQGGTDAGFLTAVEREVTGILYGWAGLDGDGATDAGTEFWSLRDAGEIPRQLFRLSGRASKSRKFCRRKRFQTCSTKSATRPS